MLHTSGVGSGWKRLETYTVLPAAAGAADPTAPDGIPYSAISNGFNWTGIYIGANGGYAVGAPVVELNSSFRVARAGVNVKFGGDR